MKSRVRDGIDNFAGLISSKEKERYSPGRREEIDGFRLGNKFNERTNQEHGMASVRQDLQAKFYSASGV